MPGPWEKYQQAGSEGPWSKYQQPEAEPEGIGDKAIAFGRGEARGLAQDAATSGRLLSYLPAGALDPIPGVGPAARLVRGLGPAAGRWGDQPVSSKTEEAGRFVGRDVLPMLAPGGLGARMGAATAGGAMRAAPTIAQILTFLHSPLTALAGRTILHESGMLPKLQELANALAPLARKAGYGVGHVGETVLGAEGGRMIPGAPEDAQDTQDPGTQPPPSSNPVPSPAQPRPTGPARGRQPGLDVDTEPPVANRSGRGDRLPLYNPAAN